MIDLTTDSDFERKSSISMKNPLNIMRTVGPGKDNLDILELYKSREMILGVSYF